MDSGRLLLLAAVGMMVVAALARTAAVGRVVAPHTAIAFGSVIAIGELLRLGLPGGREAAPIATAAALAYALLMRVHYLVGHVPPVPALQVIAVTAVGMTVGALPHIAAGRPAGPTRMATRLVAGARVAVAFPPIAGAQAVRRPPHWWGSLAGMGLAVAVGRELGLAEMDLLDLEYAALMHDIGQLALPDPIPGGATVLVSMQDQRRIAELGAEVISKAGVLDRVAELVRCQNWPARGHDPEPPVGSRIIRAANAFDDLVGGSTDRDRSAAALERLRLDTASEYDAGVVEALTEVAGKRLASRLE